ncbi:MAG: hypothetical protein ACD_4C00073G0002 [uncultured bacterium (gcode 4)]|uniref:Uncharacterized protein n=1 Tax=uncultured bacterium (gcode 4) TaxID=1234023 RepID=K2F7D0_9BACT|nr:MAG: hypothetical protein ACD_4C00073G0002 [uncultured bacterium (gcode 4)]
MDYLLFKARWLESFNPLIIKEWAFIKKIILWSETCEKVLEILKLSNYNLAECLSCSDNANCLFFDENLK